MDDRTKGMTAGAGNEESELRTREIREEIAQTRVEMSETIEAIQDRLSPSHLVAQAGETVRNATTEKVKQMANSAGEAADQVMDTSFVRMIRDNPIPAAMVGIGAAWLLLKGRSDGSHDYQTRYDGGSRAARPSDRLQRDWRVAPEAGVAVGTTGFGAYDDSLRGASSPSQDFGSGVGRYTSSRGGSVSVERVVRENPLVVGAAAALVGVAFGMSLPASGTENRLMGEARDTVVDRARELASDATDKVQAVAGQVLDSATPARDDAAPSSEGSADRESIESGKDPAGAESGGISGRSRSTRAQGRRSTS
jgi:gas vesicle protein